MLSETSFHEREEPRAFTSPPASQTTSQKEIADYVGQLATELQEMSHKAGLSLLSYLLSMVVLSAEEAATSLRKEARVGQKRTTHL